MLHLPSNVLLVVFACICYQADQVEVLIGQLYSDRAEKREQASAQLQKLGRQALPALERLAKSSDPDLVARASQILRAIQCDLAGESFARIEKRLLSAKSLRIDFSDEFVVAGRAQSIRTDTSGSIIMKADNKLLIREDITLEGSKTSNLLVSDGSQMSGSYGGDSSKVQKVPLYINKFLATVLLRERLQTVSLNALLLFDNPDYGKEMSAKDYPLTFLHESTDETGSVITYTYKISTLSPHSVEARLWYDPKTLSLLKRTIKVRVGTEQSTHTEIFKKVSVNEELSDSLFTIAERK